MNGIAEIIRTRRAPAIHIKPGSRNLSAKDAHEISNKGFTDAYKIKWVEKVGGSEAYRKGYEQINWSIKE